MRVPSTSNRPALERAIRPAAPHPQRAPLPSTHRVPSDLSRSAQHAQADPSTASPEGILQLQQLVGNQAVSGLLPHALQAKLIVGAAGDSYEREADRVADQVVGMAEGAGPVHGGASAGVQAKPPAASVTALVQRARDREDTEEDEEKGAGEVQGKRLLARELTHVVEQTGGGNAVQAQGMVQRAYYQYMPRPGFPAGWYSDGQDTPGSSPTTASSP